jgi:hypothetical protein
MRNEKIVKKLDLPFFSWKHDIHSQSGEDGIISHILQSIGIKNGYFVEFGAWDGRHLSNCAKLAEESWNGLFIEGDAERYNILAENYSENKNIKPLHRFVMATGVNSLDAILNDVEAPLSIDVLSIDIDGNDYHVWENMREHSAKLVVIEFNPTIPADILYVQQNDIAVNRGASLAAFIELAHIKGYGLVAATDWNAFFLPWELIQKSGLPTYSAEQVKNTEYETSLFHGFDGTLIAAGNRNLIWHGVQFGDEELQILPEGLRKIPIGQQQEFFEELQEFKLKNKMLT